MTPRQYARKLRQNSTDAERALWTLLRDRRLASHKFRRQVPIGRYIVDFASHRAKLIVEVDGGHHQEQKRYDDVRTAWLEAQGFTVLRFWNNDVLTNQAGVLESIAYALEQSPSP